MDSYELSEAILKGGLRATNFFNGRLLSAEALSEDQQGNREGRRRLGRAIGAGIVWGLEVSKPQVSSSAGATVVNVTAGLALNRNGDALALPDGASVKLTATAEPAQIAAGLFQVCDGLGASSIASDTGIYMLALSPAEGFSGRAPTSGLVGAAQGGAGCGSSFAVEGVQFRLVALDLADLTSSPLAGRIIALLNSTDAPSLSKLRNLLAQLCFGGAAQAQLARDPLQQATQPSGDYTLLDALRANKVLNDCDVPLALLHWQSQGLTFVEHLAVRHRLSAPVASSGWEFLIGERRESQAEAAFLQFQSQLAAIRTSVINLAAVQAKDWFAYLPPAGFVPVGGSFAFFVPTGGSRGFNAESFFAGLSVHRTSAEPNAPLKPSFLSAARIESVVRAALAYPPIDLGSDEFIRLYHVSTAPAETPSQPFLIFTSGHMPDFAEPYLNLARFSAGRFAAADGDPENTDTRPG